VGLLPPAGGDDWVGFGYERLPLEQALAWSQQPSCGGVVLFVGTVRDHAPGRPDVAWLEYEAYDEHVTARLAAIGNSKEPGTRMMVIASLEAPNRSSASVAPLTNRLTMKSFQRLATIATRRPSAPSRPWIVLANHLLLF